MAFIETFRGAVPPWECDIVEHFTVAFYFDKLELATARYLAESGIDCADPQAPGLRECFVNYRQELRVGDIYRIESAVVAASESEIILAHRFCNAATDAVCTLVEQTLTRPSGLSIELPAPSPWQGLEKALRPEVASARLNRITVRDIVRQQELNWRGELGLAAYVHRFSVAGAHLKSAFGMTPDYQREQRIGFSTFEFQLAFFASPGNGDSVEIRSCLAHVGQSSLRLVHEMYAPHSEKIFASLSQMGVHFNKDLRRPTPLPPILRAAAVAMQ